MAATVNVCLAFACVLLVAFFPVLYHIGYRHAEDRHYELARQKAFEGEFLSMETADSGGYPREQRSIQAGGNRQSANAHASAAVSMGLPKDKHQPVQSAPAKKVDEPAARKAANTQNKPVAKPTVNTQAKPDAKVPSLQEAAEEARREEQEMLKEFKHAKKQDSTEKESAVEAVEPQLADDNLGLTGPPVTNLKDIPDSCFYVSLNDLQEKHLKTSVECKAGIHNRSCMFTNLFYGANEFFSLEFPDAKLPSRSSYSTNRDGKYGHSWTPLNVPVNDLTAAREQIQAQRRGRSTSEQVVVCPGASLYFHTQFASNPGHGLWDGLYPAFVSAVRFGYVKKPLRLIPSLPEWKGPCPEGRNKGCQAKEIMDQFGTQGSIMLQTLSSLKSMGVMFYFEKLIVGSGRMAQRILTADLAVPGSRSEGVMQAYRDHMFWSHSVKLPEQKLNRPLKEIRAFIVDNRRFTKSDREALAESVQQAAKEGMNVTHIHWGQFWPFEKQLEFLASSDIYITGPGTGMMLSPFMKDGSVIVQLSDCFKRHDIIHPSSEEEYVSEGTPYMRALYYNSSIRLKGLQTPELMRLYREAFNLVQKGFEIPVPPRINLSPEGRVFVEACDLAPVTCDRMLAEMNSYVPPWQCVLDAWASFAVYEVGGYKEGGLDSSDGKNRTCTLPRTELRMLREKYKWDLGTAEINQRQC